MKYHTHTQKLAHDLLDIIEKNSLETIPKGPLKGTPSQTLIQEGRQAIENHHPDLKGVLNRVLRQTCQRPEFAHKYLMAFWKAATADLTTFHKHAINLNHLSDQTQQQLHEHLQQHENPTEALEKLILHGLNNSK